MSACQLIPPALPHYICLLCCRLHAATQATSSSYVNHDGMRVDDGRYKAFLQDAAAVVPQPRIFTGDAASAARNNCRASSTERKRASGGLHSVCCSGGTYRQQLACLRLPQGHQQQNMTCESICVTVLLALVNRAPIARAAAVAPCHSPPLVCGAACCHSCCCCLSQLLLLLAVLLVAAGSTRPTAPVGVRQRCVVVPAAAQGCYQGAQLLLHHATHLLSSALLLAATHVAVGWMEQTRCTCWRTAAMPLSTVCCPRL
jgi:hypothetical protein